MVIFSSITNLFLEIFFPRRCVGCGKIGSYLCADCYSQIEKIKTSTCYECGRLTPDFAFCERCKRKYANSLSGIVVLAHYDSGALKQLIWSLKYGGIADISLIFGQLAADYLSGLSKKDEILISSVPMHSKKMKIRGYNQSELIARFAAKQSGVKFAKLLKKSRFTKSQVGLSREERLKNVANSFSLAKGENVSGKTIYLVDDVATTGATLKECASVLRAAGARKVWGIVIGRHK